jgi:hypothetical protein
MKREFVTYSEAFKMQVVKEIRQGKFATILQAQKACGIWGGHGSEMVKKIRQGGITSNWELTTHPPLLSKVTVNVLGVLSPSPSPQAASPTIMAKMAMIAALFTDNRSFLIFYSSLNLYKPPYGAFLI